MFRRILKWTLRIVALLVIVVAIFLINLIWFRPWSLNLFYERFSRRSFSTNRSCYHR